MRLHEPRNGDKRAALEVDETERISAGVWLVVVISIGAFVAMLIGLFGGR